MEIELSNHAWKRLKFRFPEKDWGRAKWEKHINENSKRKDRIKAFNCPGEKVLKIDRAYYPMARKGGILIAKTCIPDWLFENDIELLKERLTFLEQFIHSQKHSRVNKLNSFSRAIIWRIKYRYLKTNFRNAG